MSHKKCGMTFRKSKAAFSPGLHRVNIKRINERWSGTRSSSNGWRRDGVSLSGRGRDRACFSRIRMHKSRGI